MEATQISIEQLEELIQCDAFENTISRKYYAVDNETGHVTALDVRCGEMFTEVFNSIDAALEWLAD
jgi:hypothetical protein